MRLWSLHPSYLDAVGLVALWREGLLARKVLQGQTKGYIHHPQLFRFRETGTPIHVLDFYLKTVHDESIRRGYHFIFWTSSRKGPRGNIPCCGKRPLSFPIRFFK